MTPPSLSERLEQTPLFQTVISIFIVLVLLAEVGSHLPKDSAVDQSVGKEANYIIRLLATEQQWGVFAPDPRQTSLWLEGRITFEDGSGAVWEVPEGPRVGGNFRFYRWRKWLERIRSDDFRSLWRPTALWIASLYDDRDSPVAKVELVRMFHRNTVLGDPPPYEEFVFYTYTVEPEDES